MFVYGQDAVNTVALLSAMGLGRKAIGRQTDISVRTISRWLDRGPPHLGRSRPSLVLPSDPRDLITAAEAQYAYLLGLYLGDGHLARQRRGTFQLRLFLDSRYPESPRAAALSMSAVMPGNRTNRIKHPVHNLVTVCCSSKAWPVLLPQHGPGRKHLREIKLEEWQLGITWYHPRELVRGLIHSDGCRFIAHQPGPGRTYFYPRYCFKNRSGDIMQIFCDHLDLLGVGWTLSSPEQAQIARHESVRLLDEFIGPKY